MCEGDSVGDGDDGSGFSDSDDSPTTTAITSPLHTVSTPLPPQSVAQSSLEDPINSDQVDVAVALVSDDVQTAESESENAEEPDDVDVDVDNDSDTVADVVDENDTSDPVAVPPTVTIKINVSDAAA